MGLTVDAQLSSEGREGLVVEQEGDVGARHERLDEVVPALELLNGPPVQREDLQQHDLDARLAREVGVLRQELLSVLTKGIRLAVKASRPILPGKMRAVRFCGGAG